MQGADMRKAVIWAMGLSLLMVSGPGGAAPAEDLPPARAGQLPPAAAQAALGQARPAKEEAAPALPLVKELDGRDLSQWAVTWWRWLMSAPDNRDIMADDTGELCDLGQSGPVWFLAGSYEDAPVSRHCAAPAGKYIFVPAAEMMLWDSADGRDCSLLQNDVKTVMDTARNVFIEVDGQRQELAAAWRAAPKTCFTLPNETDIYATDGYWLLLRPLAKGQHIIRFGNKIGDDGKTAEDSAQNIAYYLDVQ